MTEIDQNAAPAGPSPDLTILIPVYNERGNIDRLIKEIHEAIGTAIRFEVLIVNDGSSDGSDDELAEVRMRNQDVRVIHHANRAGKSAALHTGRLSARGRWIQTLDGDGQNDPADVLALWQHLHKDGEPATDLGLVAGIRTSRNDGTFKWLQSRIANGARRTLLNDGTPDTGCGFKLLRKQAFDDIPFFDGMHRFLPALTRRAGWDIMQFPVNDRPRTAGQSKYGFLGRLTAGIFDLLGVIWLMRRGKFPGGRTGDL